MSQYQTTNKIIQKDRKKVRDRMKVAIGKVCLKNKNAQNKIINQAVFLLILNVLCLIMLFLTIMLENHKHKPKI